MTITKAYKIRIYPNNKQETKLFKATNAARWAYNWALREKIEYYKNEHKGITQKDLRRWLTKLKEREEYEWLWNVNRAVCDQAIKDCEMAFKRFFDKLANFPKFKSKKKTKPSFYIANDKTKFRNNRVFINKIGLIKLAETDYLPDNAKLLSGRVSHLNNKWYISFTYSMEAEEIETKKERNIGIDLGIKQYMTLSDGSVYRNINKDIKQRKRIKRYKRMQRSLSRKYEMNKIKRGGEAWYIDTKNIIKLKKVMSNLKERINNYKRDYIHKTTSEIVRTKQAKTIVVEKLNISGMLKNRKLSRSIYEMSFYETKHMLQYKSNWAFIKFIEADTFYPSSKMCNSCKNIFKELSLKDRVYRCPICGYIEDRDLNAAKNLESLAS